jgi:hypothetical protein
LRHALAFSPLTLRFFARHLFFCSDGSLIIVLDLPIE